MEITPPRIPLNLPGKLSASTQGKRATENGPTHAAEDGGTSDATSNTIRQLSDGKREAIRSASQEILAINDQLKEAQASGSHELDHLHEEYSKQSDLESARQEAAMQNQRLKGYEALRDLQRAQQRELYLTKQRGDEQLHTLREQSHDQLAHEEKDGTQRLTDTHNTIERQGKHELDMLKNQMDTAEGAQRQRLEQMKTSQEARVVALTEGYHQIYDQQKENSEIATDRAQQFFASKYQAIVDQHQASLDDLQDKTDQDLISLRRGSSNKLAAYGDRQGDPFYNMVGVNGTLSESADEFVLTAQVPEHERGHLSVSVRGNELIVSGQRKNEEKIELEPGHHQATASFQSFSESFPLSAPVNAKELSREFDGDTIVIRVPKHKGFNPYQSVAKANRPPERIRAERPKFPDNLPTAKYQAQDGDAAKPESGADRARKNAQSGKSAGPDGKGGRTLS